MSAGKLGGYISVVNLNRKEITFCSSSYCRGISLLIVDPITHKYTTHRYDTHGSSSNSGYLLKKLKSVKDHEVIVMIV